MNIFFKPYNIIKNYYSYSSIKLNFFLTISIFSLFFCFSNSILNRVSKNYRELNNDKKKYIVTNFNKFIMLILTSYLFICLLFDINIFNLENWSRYDLVLKNMGGLYATTDIVGTILNIKKIKMTTLFHHIGVMIAYIYLCSMSVDLNDFNKASIVYGGFSSLAGIVNLFLGMRYIISSKNINYYFSKLSFLVYFTACFLNWSWQLFYLYNLLFVEKYYNETTLFYKLFFISFYIIILYIWINDDLILMKYLFNY